MNPTWVKGVSGNPNGRPKDPITKLLREMGNQPLNGDDNQTRAEILANMIWEAALNGDKKMQIDLIERLEGKPVAKQEITGGDSGPIGFRFVDAPSPE